MTIAVKIRCDVKRLTQSTKLKEMTTWIEGIAEPLFQDTWVNLKDGLFKTHPEVCNKKLSLVSMC